MPDFTGMTSGERSRGSQMPTPIALTIAGSDPSGGAGIQADLKTFTALGVYGAAVITALTVQNTRGVTAFEAVRPDLVAAQIRAVLEDIAVGAAKTGMLANEAVVTAVADALRTAQRNIPLVVDPVMVATSGDPLLEPAAVAALKTDLFPLAELITPNLAEAARLLDTEPADTEEAMIAQARALLGLGPKTVLVKGGHGGGGDAVDILVEGDRVSRWALPRVDTRHTHGTGCTLAAAITALRAEAVPLPSAVERAKHFVWQALQAGRTLGVGHGRGPVDHLFAARAGKSRS